MPATVANLLSFRHVGIRCALPPSQVLHAKAAANGEFVELWPRIKVDTGASIDTRGERPLDNGPQRTLSVRTAFGVASLRVTDLELITVSRRELCPLTDVLRTIIGLVHVIGWAECDGGLLWLVNAALFTPPAGTAVESRGSRGGSQASG